MYKLVYTKLATTNNDICFEKDRLGIRKHLEVPVPTPQDMRYRLLGTVEQVMDSEIEEGLWVLSFGILGLW